MKNIIAGIIIGIAATATITARAANRSEVYATCGVVTEIEGDTVTFTEPGGTMWSFEGVEDWFEGDIVAAVMDDNGTPEIKDDKIVSVRYKGYTE